jgi:hypothetical protein
MTKRTILLACVAPLPSVNIRREGYFHEQETNRPET